MVVLADPGRAVVGAARRERGGVEGVDRRAVGAAKATCVPVPYGSRCVIQNSGLSSAPKPAAFHSSNAITTR